MPIALTNAQTRFLRGQAHPLRAMLQVGGKGITDALVAEVGNALEQHELVKIGELAQRADAALVQRIGHTAVLYRPSKERRQIVLPRG